MDQGIAAGTQEAPLDMALGLKHTGGREPLYRMLLTLYAQQNAQAAGRVRESLVQGEFAVAERLAHSLKGSSAQVGATLVERHAATLEMALRRGAVLAEVETVLANLDKSLRQTLDWLAAAQAA